MKSKFIFKKFSVCIIAFVLCFVTIGGYADIKVRAFDYTQGIMFNQYYRIRSAVTGLYLTMNSTSDAEGVGCSLQARIANSPKQIFLLGIDYYTSTYYLIPSTSSSRRVLSLTSSSDVNNNNIVLRTNNSNAWQKWKITPTVEGYSLRAYSGNKVMAPNSLVTSIGTRVGTWDYTARICDWVLEPAYSGRASYFAITNLSSEDSISANNMVNDMRDMGYTHERVNLPLAGQVLMTMSENRITFIHGHGNVGYVLLKQPDGSNVRLYSENGTNYLSLSTRKNSYIVFITCNSAMPSSTRTSMVHAAYLQGASCVTGFRNTVAGGEEYFEIVMNYLEENPGETIEEALNFADEEFSCNQCTETNCPANPTNRTTMGQKNISINMN